MKGVDSVLVSVDGLQVPMIENAQGQSPANF
jgi:hypothetical protein